MWMGLEPRHIAATMQANDLREAKTLMQQALLKCDSCGCWLSCPEWQGCADEPVLNCPESYAHPPSQDLARYMPKRASPYLPNPGEFPEHPELRPRVELIQAALDCGDLTGTAAAITHPNLRSWMAMYDPVQKPDFLYGSVEASEPKKPKVQPKKQAVVVTKQPEKDESLEPQKAPPPVTQPKMEATPQLLRLSEVMKRTGLKRSSIYQKIEEEGFPQQVKVGGRASAWVSAEIDAWIAAKIAAR